ncbi:DEAD/DEAH box helicase [Lonepinella sp. BR2271]|uniref:DEAD/DEAH box helicase n=1 Tax=Lonepinella sp. BR2271 TaxID=3434550 RepID=UPI003F6DE1FC
MLSYQELESKLKSKDEIGADNAFVILQSVCNLVNQSPEDIRNQYLVLRVLDRKEEFEPFLEIINGLVSHFGLYPYLDTDVITIKDAIAREMHRPALISNSFDMEKDNEKESDNIENEGIVFHRVQAEIFQYLINRENVILSAPTSFGKSALIDSLVQTNIFNNIILIVPTIALIDETRRRLSRFKNDYKIITHASQTHTDRNIFILTQERAIDFPELPQMDILILDEFYKLDPREDTDRAMTLNHAFYKLKKQSKQFYLLGPNIQNIPEGLPEEFKCRFIRTDYATVVTELIRVTPEKNDKKHRYDKLLSLCKSVNEPTLIFCSSPQKAREITQLLVDNCIKKGMGLLEAAHWVGENYHPEWIFVKGLNAGIGMHHGRIPRALAHLCVKGFNEGKLPFLVCTSTLIEGVNTKAKNIIIFDNMIAKRKYDFFTFNNIRGRSGRMFQYFIGNVYIFNDPPEEELPLVEIPIFSQEDNSSESLLIQIEKEDIKDNAWNRIKKYYQQDILSVDVIRSNSGVNPDNQLELAKYLIQNNEKNLSLAWSSWPNYKQLELLCELIWDYLVNASERFAEIRSGKQLAFKINQIKNNTIKDIIKNKIDEGAKADDAIESELNFTRQWMQFHFPRFAMAVCRIQNEIADRFNAKKADYSFFCGQVENMFSDPALIALDEYGLPFPLAKKIENQLNANGSLDQAISNLSKIKINELELTPFEEEVIKDVRETI